MFIILLTQTSSFLCSQITISSDTDHVGDIVLSGDVQRNFYLADWFGLNPNKHISPFVSEFYLYIDEWEYIGPDLTLKEWHTSDENASYEHKWTRTKVEEDEETSGWLKETKVFKVRQTCQNKEGGTQIHSNVTFAVTSCYPITINWFKDCGQPNTRRDSLMIGLSQKGQEVVKDGKPTAPFDDELYSEYYVVSDNEEYTQFWIYMSNPDISTYIRAPYILTDHEVLYPSINGTAAAGGWLDSTPRLLQVNWNCLKKLGKKEEAILVIEQPYFHDIEIYMQKKCGTSAYIRKPFSIPWKQLFYFSIVGTGIGLVLYAMYQLKQGKQGLDVLPYPETIRYYKDQVVNKYYEWKYTRLHQPNTEEYNDDDDGRLGFNVHTVYGSI